VREGRGDERTFDDEDEEDWDDAVVLVQIVRPMMGEGQGLGVRVEGWSGTCYRWIVRSFASTVSLESATIPLPLMSCFTAHILILPTRSSIPIHVLLCG
jgi:hypothetical protein